MKDFIFKLDTKVAEFMHKIYLNCGDFANVFMEIISNIAHMGLLFLSLGLILTIIKRTRKIGITIIGAVGLGFICTNLVLKNIISRARPFNTNSQFMLWWIDAGAIKETGFSFPSGHVTATTAFAVAIFLMTKKKYSWPILFLPVIMAASRIYLMVHFFSDCVGALVVGTICAFGAYLIAKWIYKSNIKLFVWFRNLDIFKSRKSAPQKQGASQPIDEPSQDYVYTSQKEEMEQSANIRLIEEDIKSKGTNIDNLDD